MRQLTGQVIYDFPLGSLPARTHAPHHKLTAAEVTERYNEVARILKLQGAKLPSDYFLEEENSLVRACVLHLHLNRKHTDVLKKLKRAKLPANHPLKGINVPLNLPHDPPESAADRNYPHLGFLLLNAGDLYTGRQNFLYWSGLQIKEIERLPDCTDLQRLVIFHELGHIVQNRHGSMMRAHSINCAYRIEANADLFGLESYRRYNASRADIEIQYALTALRQMLAPLRPKSFPDFIYWNMPALMSGLNGVDIWPLYRVAAAVIEAQHLAATSLHNSIPSYRSTHLNSMLKETLLKLHEHPPTPSSPYYSYKDIYATFNQMARAQDMSADKQTVVRCFNEMTKHHSRQLADRTRGRRLKLLQAYHHLWNSDLTLCPDTQLMLGLTLEAAGLFIPSLKTIPPQLHKATPS